MRRLTYQEQMEQVIDAWRELFQEVGRAVRWGWPILLLLLALAVALLSCGMWTVTGI